MQNRRTFFKTAGTLAALPLVNQWSTAANHPIITHEPEEQVESDQAQKAWMKLQFGMFIHWGVNTYYDAEWSDGTLDIAKVNPSKLDTDQWCRTAT